jgi:hypothetical protein
LHGSDLGTIKIGPSSTKYEPKPVVFWALTLM